MGFHLRDRCKLSKEECPIGEHTISTSRQGSHVFDISELVPFPNFIDKEDET